MGTRLVATTESSYSHAKKQLLVQTGTQASDRPATLRTTLYDELNEAVRWPAGITGRAICNDFTSQWDGQTPLQVSFWGDADSERWTRVYCEKGIAMQEHDACLYSAVRKAHAFAADP